MLFAQVIVKQRTRVEELTYAITPEVLPYIVIGSSVLVPIRRKEVLGVVTGFKRSVGRAIKGKTRPILAISLDLNPYSAEQIAVIYRLAKEYGTTLAEVAWPALGHPAGKQTAREVTHQVRFITGSNSQRLDLYRQLFERFNGKKHMLFLFSQRQIAYAFYQLILSSVPSKNTALCFSDSHAASDRQIRALLVKNDPWSIIGTQKDAFLPLCQGDFLIIDQPANLGAVTEQRPYLAAKKIGLARLDIERLNLILGDTLPTVGDWPAIKRGSWQITYVIAEKKPVLIVDRQQQKELIAPSILAAIAQRLIKGEKVLALALARGRASAYICAGCGQVISCQRCARTTTFVRNNLICRYCGSSSELPKQCPHCRGATFRPIGEGVELIAEQLTRYFPQATIATLSTDQPSFPQSAQITVATEKVLSFIAPQFDLLAVLSVDRLLSVADLDGSWRLLCDLIELKSRVKKIAVQTIFPDHPIWSTLTTGDWQKYFDLELALRRRLNLPPYGSQFELVGSGHRVAHLLEQSSALTAKLSRQLPQANFGAPQISSRSGRLYGASEASPHEPSGDMYLAVPVLMPYLIKSTEKQLIAGHLPPNWAVRY